MIVRSSINQKSIQTTAIHLSSTYSRSKVNGKSFAKRSFSIVVCGMMLGSNLIGGVLSNTTAQSENSFGQSISSGVLLNRFIDDVYLQNLRMAVQSLNADGWNLTRLRSLSNSLMEIEKKLSGNVDFLNIEALRSVILETEDSLVTNPLSNRDRHLLAEEQRAKAVLVQIKQKIGISIAEGKVNLSLLRSNASETKSNTVLASSTKEITVYLNGVKQHYAESPVMSNGTVLVPMRGIFESLGANLVFDAKNKTIHAKRNETQITVIVGAASASVNGKNIPLSVKAQTIHNITMVPLRFVSEALGATIEWNAETMTVKIESPSVSTSATPNVKSVSDSYIKYGNHVYGTNNQTEYTKVMNVVAGALKEGNSIKLGELYTEYYYKYIEGYRWSGDTSDRSIQNRGLKSAEDSIGVLVADGVSIEEIERVYQAQSIAIRLLNKAANPGEGSYSAYDALFYNISNCVSDAHVKSVVFDSIEYNTIVYGGNGHAEMAFQINGLWYETVSGTFERVDPVNSLATDGSILVQPTFGDMIHVVHSI
ncbi:copper amine oxidase N-terminal domain-containing protein [Paenibacillus donghaensis]|uniref:Copper amine oxidase-like N-terminal domain-containing protein n=1 Tax=Paenibacillus donghaensis TaxID=414771 RepID=A0A2Z2KW47_9BACL|nr:copper amine oxidase N-terminal domain-containing protein [Paenibacillus donghaensis]ASA25621.1 hypothetical protein B9T62_35750 [Paenibacillus donghaensis]